MGNSREDQNDSLLDETHSDALRAFLRRELPENPNLRDRFLSFARTMNVDLYEYRTKIERGYGYQSVPHFEKFEREAESFVENGRYRDAAIVYRALFESMREHLYEFDPHQGGFEHDEAFQNAIASYAAVIRDAGLHHEDKREYIDYLFETYRDEHDEGGHPDHYAQALWEVCTTESDYRYWLDYVRDAIDEWFGLKRVHGYGDTEDDDTNAGTDGDSSVDLLDGYTERQWLSLYTALLDRLDEREELRSVLRTHYRAAVDLCLRYAQLLVTDGDHEAAIQVAETGIETFSTSDTILVRKFLVEQFENTDQESYRRHLTALFVQTEDWQYYDALKSSYAETDWPAVVDEIVDQLDGRWTTQTVIDIYLREGRSENAFETVTSARNLDRFEEYIDDLGEYDPVAYFDAYRREIETAAADASRRKYYRQVADHLQTIQTLGQDRRFENLMTFLRDEYSNRPAFLDELEKAGF